MSKTDSSGTYSYRRDGADVTDPVLTDGVATYTPGVSQHRSSTTTYDLDDYLGSATRQTSTMAATTATRTYDAFGNLDTSTGTPLGPFGFVGASGYQEDHDSGLTLLGHRYYDPSTGRFLTKDPAKDGRNWYAYCDNASLIAIDPEGYSSVNKHKMVQKINQIAGTTSKGQCAKYVRIALEAGGADTSGHPVGAGDYGPVLTGNGGTVVSGPGYKERYGDVSVIPGSPSHPYGHIAIYNGKQWVSDFRQRRMWPYKGDPGKVTIYRFPDK